jgi:hypothetical protein
MTRVEVLVRYVIRAAREPEDVTEVVDRLLNVGALQDPINEHGFEDAGKMAVESVVIAKVTELDS